MVVSQLCVNCESGKFSSEDNSPSCSGCAAGKYLSNTAATEESSACSSCDAGKYSGASSTSCTSCDGGKYLTNAVTDDESSACTNCGTGQYSGTASASCSDCAAGKYLDYPATGVESSACKDCQAGTYSELPVPTRALDCSQCSDGKYSGLGSPSCTSCAAGKNVANSEISVESTACKICTAGTFSNTPVPSLTCTIWGWQGQRQHGRGDEANHENDRWRQALDQENQDEAQDSDILLPDHLNTSSDSGD